jgi:hypothetical protein
MDFLMEAEVSAQTVHVLEVSLKQTEKVIPVQNKHSGGWCLRF